MIDRETAKTVRKTVKRALELEIKSVPGRLNALGMVLIFVLFVIAGTEANVESMVVRAFGDDQPAGFPWGLAIVAYVICVLFCVCFLGFLGHLIPGEDSDE